MSYEWKCESEKLVIFDNKELYKTISSYSGTWNTVIVCAKTKHCHTYVKEVIHTSVNWNDLYCNKIEKIKTSSKCKYILVIDNEKKNKNIECLSFNFGCLIDSHGFISCANQRNGSYLIILYFDKDGKVGKIHVFHVLK